MNKLLSKISVFAVSAFIFSGYFSPVFAVDEVKATSKASACDSLRDCERRAISDLAKHCGLETSELESALSFKVSEKSKFFGKACSLVPLCDREEHLNCLLKVYSEARPEYMRYYLDGKLKNPTAIKVWFENSVQNIDKDSPTSATFLIKVGDDVVGRIGIGPIANRGKVEAEIGYAIEESYSGAGVMSKAVVSAISFLKLLREKGKECYDFTRLRATAKSDNKASNEILLRSGFVKSEPPADDDYDPENEYEYYYYFVQ